MNNKLFFIYFLVLTAWLHAQEYLYPVCTFEHQQTTYVYVLHQHAQGITLWQWNPHTKQAIVVLPSTAQPAGIQIMPGNNAISFVDHGRIKIKPFDSAVVTALDLQYPLYDVGVHRWLSDAYCYLSAQERGRRSIYQLKIDGSFTQLLADSCTDYVYPSLVGSQLFTIASTSLPGYKSSRPYYSVVCADLERHTTEVVYDAGKEDFLAFLSMKNHEEGFVVGYSSSLSNRDVVTTFDYYHLQKKSDGWHTSVLFSFEVPVTLLSGADRLHESLFALLPRHVGNCIYYVANTNKKETPNLNVFKFDLVSSLSEQKTFAVEGGKIVFSPVVVGSSIFYGGAITDDGENDEISLKKDENLMHFITLARLK